MSFSIKLANIRFKEISIYFNQCSLILILVQLTLIIFRIKKMKSKLYRKLKLKLIYIDRNKY